MPEMPACLEMAQQNIATKRQRWAACGWAWPLRCLGQTCTCQAAEDPIILEPPELPYAVYLDEAVPTVLPYPLNYWPRKATLCAHPAPTRCRANFGLQQVESAGGPEWEWLSEQ